MLLRDPEWAQDPHWAAGSAGSSVFFGLGSGVWGLEYLGLIAECLAVGPIVLGFSLQRPFQIVVVLSDVEE